MSKWIYFPTFPGYIRTPSNSKIGARNHRIYVDFPHEIVMFYIDKVKEASTGQVVDIKRSWSSFLRAHPVFSPNGDRLCYFFRDSSSNIGKVSGRIGFNVDKESFDNYLNKQSRIIFDLCLSAENMDPLLMNMAQNFYMLNQMTVPYQPRGKFKAQRWQIKLTADFNATRKSLDRLRGLIERLDTIAPSYSLFTDLDNLYYSVDKLMFQTSYLSLRDMLEKIVVIIGVIKISEELFNMKAVKKNIRMIQVVQTIYSLYYQNLNHIKSKSDVPKDCEVGSIDHFVQRFASLVVKKHIVGPRNPRVVSESNQEKFYKNTNACLPILHFGKNIINDVSKKVGLDSSLGKAYGMCGSYAHRSLPLPIDSMLELKVFRKFLSFLSASINKMIKVLKISANPSSEKHHLPYSNSKFDPKKVDKYYRLNRKRLSKIVREILFGKNGGKSISDSNKFGIESFFSLFKVISPGARRFQKGEFTAEMLVLLADGIQQYSFTVSLDLDIRNAVRSFPILLYKSRKNLKNPVRLRYSFANIVFLAYLVSQYGQN